MEEHEDLEDGDEDSLASCAPLYVKRLSRPHGTRQSRHVVSASNNNISDISEENIFANSDSDQSVPGKKANSRQYRHAAEEQKQAAKPKSSNSLNQPDHVIPLAPSLSADVIGSPGSSSTVLNVVDDSAEHQPMLSVKFHSSICLSPCSSIA